MGSGDWFKTILSRKKTRLEKSKKTKDSASGQSNESKLTSQTSENLECNGSCSLKTVGLPCVPDENAAATRIQTAFRCYKCFCPVSDRTRLKLIHFGRNCHLCCTPAGVSIGWETTKELLARKILHSLRGAEKLKAFTQRHSVQKQASITLCYLRSCNKVQTQIAARRHSMVVESRIRQKKHDSQLKLEARLHDIEVEWCGGSETREEILAKIQQREEAAVKRERAMAYAFSHQWRANSGMNQNNFVYEFGKGNWGWSWRERWVASHPWEPRLPAQSTSPRKVQTKATNKLSRIANASSAETPSTSIRPTASDGKRPPKKLPISTAEKTVVTEASSKPVKETTP